MIEIQRLRDAHTASLTAQCTVWRNTPTTDATGGQVENWNVVATYPCRLMPERDRRLQQVIAEKGALEVYYRLTLPYNADIRAADKVEYAGEMYFVVALWESHDLRTAIRAVVSKLK